MVPAFKDLKGGLPGQVEEPLGGKANAVREEAVTVGKKSGFLLEFAGPGNGKFPEAGLL